MFGLIFIFFINSPEEGVNNVFMEFRCQNEENCGCQSWKRSVLVSGAQGNAGSKCAMDVHWEGDRSWGNFHGQEPLCLSAEFPGPSWTIHCRTGALAEMGTEGWIFLPNSTTWINAPSKIPLCTAPPKPVMPAERSCSPQSLWFRIPEMEMLTWNYKSWSTDVLKRKT